MKNAIVIIVNCVVDMKGYLQKLIQELERRGERLKALIRCPIEITELNSLAVKCEEKIDVSIKQLQEIETYLNLPDCDEQTIRFIYRRYHDEYRNIDLIERYGISLLKVDCPDLKYHNRLIAQIQKESNIPLTIASVASFSTDSFFYAPKTHVIFVPAAEHLFLQLIPILYHELGHYVSGHVNHLRLSKLKEKVANCRISINRHYSDILKRELLETHSKEHLKITFAIMNKWKGSWFEEIFCDAFATFLVGPAYAWSWVHIVTKMNDDVFYFNEKVYLEHPSHEARFRFIIRCLTISGFEKEVEDLKKVWNSLIFVSGKTGSPDYFVAFPDKLFEEISNLIKTGLEENNFELASPKKFETTNGISKSLNEVWKYFWNSPDDFLQFEEKIIKEILDKS